MSRCALAAAITIFAAQLALQKPGQTTARLDFLSAFLSAFYPSQSSPQRRLTAELSGNSTD
jgi:hypothetical protein